MKKQCRNCQDSIKVTDEQKRYIQKVQAIMAKAIMNKDKKNEIQALPEYEKFKQIVGLAELNYNNLSIEIQGGDIYRICTNKDQLNDAGVEGFNVHKTYYTCEHWEAEND